MTDISKESCTICKWYKSYKGEEEGYIMVCKHPHWVGRNSGKPHPFRNARVGACDYYDPFELDRILGLGT